MFNRKPGAKKPVVRKETVLVPSEPKKTPAVTNPAARQAPTNRFQLTTNAKSASVSKPSSRTKAKTKTPVAAKRAIEQSRGLKRKSATPDRDRVVFSSDEDDDGSSDAATSDSDASRKRIKSSVSSVESRGPRRSIVQESAFNTSKELESLSIIHSADATSKEYAAKFQTPWDQDYSTSVQLQYPTHTERERFELKWPKNYNEDYRPMEDITQTIEMICDIYFPTELREKYSSEETGFGRRFSRAFHRQDQEVFEEIVKDFNAVMAELVATGKSRQELESRPVVPLKLANRITEQIYARTVSPKVETLRKYQNGGDNVYGELLPPFCDEIFRHVGLNHDQIFIDLGSGVGNVVLQAAIQIGCESWGIEMMKNPCDLADLQLSQLEGKAKQWGIACGNVHLLRGDFTTNSEITTVLRKADVVLVNNQAFTPELNDKLIAMFLDLKEGAKVVSLRPFVPEGHKISKRNQGAVINMFTQKMYEYFSKSVSWTEAPGKYFIAEKDSRPLEQYLKEHGLS